jgi:hypothetical protein
MRKNTYTISLTTSERRGSTTITNNNDEEIICYIIEYGFLNHPELEYAVDIYNKSTEEKTRLLKEATLISPDYPKKGKYAFEIFEHIDNKLVKFNFEQFKPVMLSYLIEHYSDSKVMHSS